MDIFNVFTLMGGLALFLFGMSLMGDALERQAGGALNRILERLTSNRLKGFLLGMGVTAVIQSSSATTVMAVGFVNSGIMRLSQAIGIIFGANVGTTITAWLLSLAGLQGDAFLIRLLKPSSFSPLLAFAGIVLYMFGKQEKRKNIGVIMLGFAILMTGMDTMSGAVKPLADEPAFTNFLLLFSNPLFGVLAGTAITAVIQSSSASIGILQALALSGSVTFGTALPIILGQNIGTCITSLLSSIGANKNAKRVAAVHLYFNLIGTVLFLAVFYTIHAISPMAFLWDNATAMGIAIIHTTFNLATTAVMLPLSNQLEKLACMTIRDEESSPEQPQQILDTRLLINPSVAINQCRRLTVEMACIAAEQISRAIDLLETFSQASTEEIMTCENQVDQYEDALGSYLVQVAGKQLSDSDSREVSGLLHTIGEFERISDHAVNIAEAAQELEQKHAAFSGSARQELSTMSAAVQEILSLTVDAFVSGDALQARQVEPLEQVVDYLRNTLKTRHIDRLQNGSCSIETGFVYIDLLTNFERVADHCSNIAAYVIELENGTLATHEYIQGVKGAPDLDFVKHVTHYREKYRLEPSPAAVEQPILA